MGKSILVNVLIILGLILAYYTNIFNLFAMSETFYIAIILLIGLFIMAFKVLGSPFNKKGDVENNESDDEDEDV